MSMEWKQTGTRNSKPNDTHNDEPYKKKTKENKDYIAERWASLARLDSMAEGSSFISNGGFVNDMLDVDDSEDAEDDDDCCGWATVGLPSKLKRFNVSSFEICQSLVIIICQIGIDVSVSREYDKKSLIRRERGEALRGNVCKGMPGFISPHYMKKSCCRIRMWWTMSWDELLLLSCGWNSSDASRSFAVVV